MIVQLAAERQTILNFYDGSEEQLDRLIEVEAAIVAEPRSPESDVIKIEILSNKPDFGDIFIQRLANSLN